MHVDEIYFSFDRSLLRFWNECLRNVVGANRNSLHVMLVHTLVFHFIFWSVVYGAVCFNILPAIVGVVVVYRSAKEMHVIDTGKIKCD